MAEEITCPACQTPNDPWNELCDACGAELHDEAAVQADATDGDEFVEPQTDGDPGGFEDVEEVHAYDQDNPDYGVDADDVVEDEFAEVPVEADQEIHEAVEGGDEGLAEIPVEGYELAEDTGADEVPFEQVQPSAGEHPEQAAPHDEPESIEYELEPLEEDFDDDGFDDDEYEPSDDQYDGGQSLDASADETFGQWDDEARDELDSAEAAFRDPDDVDFDDDEFAADGGQPLEPAIAAQFGADGEPEFGEFGDDNRYGGQEDELVEASEVEEELPPPPELEAILNPESVERAEILPLPTPGPYVELATLTVFKGGEQLGEVAIDFNCTVLGLDRDDDHEDYSEEVAEEVEELDEIAEFDPIEAVDAPADEAGFELEAIENEADDYSEDDFAAFSSQQQDDLASEEAAEDDFDSFGEEEDDDFESFGEEDAFAGDEDGHEHAEELAEAEIEPAVDAEPYEDPEDLEEGPVIDLSQFGDASRFATRHGYLFRQNKHYTLYVLSDMGTQVNDEVLTIGDYRELSDGDVIVLGGEVALKFNEPAA